MFGVDESNYIGAYSQDAMTGDSFFTVGYCLYPGNYDDVYTLRSDEKGNIYTGRLATNVSTPKIIEFEQLYVSYSATVSEIILDREKSHAIGILCYGYGNKYLSYSYKFAEKLGKKYNLPVVYKNKTLYDNRGIEELEVYEETEIIKGIEQYFEPNFLNEIKKSSYDKRCKISLDIFEKIKKFNIKSKKEAKQIVKKEIEKITKEQTSEEVSL